MSGERYYTAEQLAEHLQISPVSLEKWRRQGGGPDYIKVGRCVRYASSAVDAWLEQRTVSDAVVEAVL
jgi:predicted DNA-binding transcriptional regulator AlpA